LKPPPAVEGKVGSAESIVGNVLTSTDRAIRRDRRAVAHADAQRGCRRGRAKAWR